MRVAWFSPLPPDTSGIAAYCAELLPLLAQRHAIDAFIDDGDGREAAAKVSPIEGVTIRGAFDFQWSHATRPYDVIVYQLGNQLCHGYIWPYMVRYPGVVVLHDGQLHHSRAARLLRRGLLRDYRSEFSYCYPLAPRAMHEVVISGMGESMRSIYYEHPMLRIPVEAARVLAVHNALLASELEEQFPGAAVMAIRQGVRDLTDSARTDSAEIRRRLGIPPEAVVFAALGRATPEKRLGPALKALAHVRASNPAGQTWLLCVGATTDYYDVRSEAAALGVADALAVTGYVEDEDIGNYLRAADVGLCLRWPTGRETSASWLRFVAAGKPTLITDLAHLTDVPAMDPRTLDRLPVGATADGTDDPIAMIVELTDEPQMLRIAIRQLTENAPLRVRLGEAARRYWTRHATVELMAQDYEMLFERAQTAPQNPHPRWPEHLTTDTSEHAAGIAAGVGIALDWK